MVSTAISCSLDWLDAIGNQSIERSRSSYRCVLGKHGKVLSHLANLDSIFDQHGAVLPLTSAIIRTRGEAKREEDVQDNG